MGERYQRFSFKHRLEVLGALPRHSSQATLLLATSIIRFLGALAQVAQIWYAHVARIGDECKLTSAHNTQVISPSTCCFVQCVTETECWSAAFCLNIECVSPSIVILSEFPVLHLSQSRKIRSPDLYHNTASICTC